MRSRRPWFPGLLTIVLLASLVFSASQAQARNCISTIANDTCITGCLADLERACGSDQSCHLVLASDIQLLAQTPSPSALCSAVVGVVRSTCNCP
jgi:hypothetical protein